ncbi:MAG: flippase [Ruminococcaceae bacterium]|nr:flippase [Oscillospiraceae bacterium]
MKQRSIAENLFYNMLYQVLATVLPIVTTPYVARALGLGATGVHSYTESIVTYFTLFGALGTSMYAVRKIAVVREDEKSLAQATLEILALKLILMLITLAVFIPSLCVGGEYAYLFRIHIVTIVATGLDISWFYQGIEDFKKVTIRNLLMKLLFIVALFVFVKTPEDLPIYVLAIVGSTLIGNLMMIAYLPGYVKLRISEPLKPFRHLKESLALFVPQIMNYVYVLLDRTLLGWMTNTDNVGIYDQAQRLVRMIAGMMQTLGYVMMARISNLTAANDSEGIRKYIHKSIDFTLFLALPAVMGIIAVAPDFIPLFLGEEFLQVVPTLQIISVVVLTSSCNSILGVQLLIPLKREKIYTIAMISGAAVNVAINVCLIPLLGVFGACIASITAELVVMLICYFNTRDMISLKTVLKNNAWVAIASVVMFLAVTLVAQIQMHVILKLLAEVGAGVAVYVAITAVTKNEIFWNIFGKVKNLLRRRG